MENTQLVGVTAAQFLEMLQSDVQDGEIVEVCVCAIIHREAEGFSELQFEFSTEMAYRQLGMVDMLKRAVLNSRAPYADADDDDGSDDG